MVNEVIKRFREDMDLTQGQLAAKINRSPVTISFWETAKSNPSGRSRRQLEKVFGLESGYLDTVHLVKEEINND